MDRLKRIVLTFAVLLLRDACYADDAPLHKNAVTRFASKAEARQALCDLDRFFQLMSRFDRESRLNVSNNPGIESLQSYIESQIVEWDEKKSAKVDKLLASIRTKLEPFDLPLPEVVLLVNTTGREEGNAAYCRRNAVVLPNSYLEMPESRLEKVLIHELFHIISTQAPGRTRELYRIIGFEPVDPIDLPATLRDRRITNPDAPEVNCVIELDIAKETVTAAPILIADSDFDPRLKKSFFSYLKLRLMAVTKEKDRWRTMDVNGMPKLFDPAEIPHFAQKVGGNTRYIFHPEEILAENFVHMVQQTADLPNPEIVEQLRTHFSKK